MAATEHQPSARYARENWWGEDLDGNDDQDSTVDHDLEAGVSRAEWIAHRILKESAPALLCPIALQDPEDDQDLHDRGQYVELTDPEVYVPESIVETDGRKRPMYGDHRRSRVNPVHGYITGPAIEDRPTEDFLDTVEVVLQLAKEREGLRASVAERIRTLATTRKRHADLGVGTDVDILAEVIRAIETPTYLDEEGF